MLANLPKNINKKSPYMTTVSSKKDIWNNSIAL